MSARIEYPGVRHGDKVLLTGASWEATGFNPEKVYEVDDVSFHRPVIYDYLGGDGGEWYIFESDPSSGVDFSVTKVEA